MPGRKKTPRMGVAFVGAGPGDPGLMTLKGRRLLDEADVIIYAGSLINPALLKGVKAELYDSSGMELGGITRLISKSWRQGKKIVRLHSGDISFYSAVTEQIELLREKGIPCEVVPGVSSLGAGAAALKQELTVPGVSQSVVVTRMAGRTPVPERESIASLAAHGATMVIFLSAGMIEKVVSELKKGGYADDTPVSVIERASWPGQKLIEGTVADIAGKAKEAGIKKTALIYVGRAMRPDIGTRRLSRLYDKDFEHGYRKKK